MSLKKRYLFGMLSGAGSVVIKTGLNMLVIPVMIAHLGLDAFGFYILLISILEISMLLDFGATGALVKLLGSEAPDGGKRQQYLKVGHSLFSWMAVAFVIAGVALAPVLTGQFQITPDLLPIAEMAFMLIAVEAALAIYSCYTRSVLLAHCAHQWTNVADTLYAVVSNLGTLILLFSGFHLLAILWVRVLGALLRTGMMMAQTARIEPGALRPRAPLKRETCREVVQLSFHAMMINFSIIISHKIDDIVIARFLPIGAVGIYEIVFRFVGIIIQICLKLHEGTFPLYARMSAENRRDDARRLFLRMSGVLNFVACMILMLILSFYPQLFHIFSAGKIPMEQTLPVLMLAVPITLSGVLQMPATVWLFSWGHERYLTVTSMATALANLILSVILVQFFGLVGVALGTLIPQLIQHQGFLIRKASRELGISLRQYLGDVYAGLLLPLGVSVLWVQLWKPLLTEAPGSAYGTLIGIGLIAVTVLLMGGALWFWLTATPMEREIVTVKFLQPLRLKLKYKPITGNPTHG